MGSTALTMRLGSDSITLEAQPRYKLIYFDARGIGEAIRLIFVYANESFVDERLTKKQWLRIKERKFYVITILKLFYA